MWIKGFLFVGVDHHSVPIRDDIQVSGWEEAYQILESAKKQTLQLEPEDHIQGYLYTLLERRPKSDK